MLYKPNHSRHTRQTARARWDRFIASAPIRALRDFGRGVHIANGIAHGVRPDPVDRASNPVDRAGGRGRPGTTTGDIPIDNGADAR